MEKESGVPESLKRQFPIGKKFTSNSLPGETLESVDYSKSPGDPWRVVVKDSKGNKYHFLSEHLIFQEG